MPVTAKLNFLRIAPRKTRLVADLIRGKSVEEAETILNFTIKKGVSPFLKLLKQAVANAKNNFQLDQSNLYISKLLVDEGPKLKRWMPRARGSAYEIQKKTSHITLVLDELIKKGKKVKRAPATEKAEKTEAKIAEEIKEKPETEKNKKEKLRPEIKEEKPAIAKGGRKIFRRMAF